MGWTQAGQVWSKMDRAVTRALSVSRAVANTWFTHALTAREKEALGIALYDQAGQFQNTDLHPWEARWFEAVLPKAPARILVTAAGAGRELVNLSAWGYELEAFEPAPSMAAQAQRRLGERGHVRVGDYQLFCDCVLRRASGALAMLRGQTFDAVLLGWGSLSHVLGATRRLEVLRAACALCPEGPLLVSMWCEGQSGAPRLGSGRLSRLAARAGRQVGRRRGAQVPESGECFVPSLGSGVVLTRQEIEGWSVLGREVVWETRGQGYAHVTLWPQGS